MTAVETVVFVDTNIWLYALIDGADLEKSLTARQLLATQPAQLITSTQVTNEVCVNLIRKAGTGEDTVRDLILAFFRRYEVVPTTEALLLEASELRGRYSLSYWDSLIVAAALQGKAGTLFSEDMAKGLVINERLVIVNPFVR